jgi:4-diphosphocytidyl-2-C-methyl-D-erythritol kinase
LQLAGWWLMLIAPGVHVSTAEVYANTAPATMGMDLRNALVESPDNWTRYVQNRMEEYVLQTYPSVVDAKQRLLVAGATYASMSGSGSSVFGLFKQKPELPILPEGQRAWLMRL